jgi:hypothetical protein
MKNEQQMPASLPTEKWLERFVRQAPSKDIAFVTGAGHVVSWQQYRMTYPRYRPVAPDWQPPAQEIEALVLHFDRYEVSIPVVLLERALQDLSKYRDEDARLRRAWHEAHPDNPPMPMEAQIAIERMAAVHSRIEVFVATDAFEHEAIQDILGFPGVRIERAAARLSDVSSLLRDERPTEASLQAKEFQIHEKFGLTNEPRNPELRKSYRPIDPRGVLKELVAEGNPLWRFRDAKAGKDLAALYETVRQTHPDAQTKSADAFRRLLFIQAIREGTTSSLDWLAHLLAYSALPNVELPNAPLSSPKGIDLLPWATLAEEVQQYRTAWGLAIRTVDGRWRDYADHSAPPYGSNRPSYRRLRLDCLGLTERLARRSTHPYWSNVFSNWEEDYRAGMPTESVPEPPADSEPDDQLLLRRIRPAQSQD